MIIDYSWFLFIINNSWFYKAILFLFNLVIHYYASTPETMIGLLPYFIMLQEPVRITIHVIWRNLKYARYSGFSMCLS